VTITRERAAELGRLGGTAKAAKLAKLREPKGPLAWSLLDLADRAGLVGESWLAGRTLLKVSVAEPLTDAELAVFQACTGRERPPTVPPREIWEASGRRSAKSFRAALNGVWAATCRHYTTARGERVTVLLMGADKEQAVILRNYAGGIIDTIPELARLVVRRTKWRVELATGVDVQVATSDYRLVRGRTVCLAVCDELAFWKSETSTSPDVEVIGALRPSLATIAGAQLVAVSTVYSRAGALFRTFETYYGQDDPTILCWKAPTATMNPTIAPDLIARELAEDPERAKAEWLSEWRTDTEQLVTLEAVRACVIAGRREQAPVADVKYYGFTDPSGGSSDSMTLCIGHREGSHVVVDAIRERKPRFDPKAVVAEFAELLRSYRVRAIRGDRFGGAWVQAAFRDAGVEYLPAEAPKSELYARVVPMINTGSLDLLDLPVLCAQLAGLERRVVRGTGREVIDHGPHSHDDVANAVAGLAAMITRRPDVSLTPPGPIYKQVENSFGLGTFGPGGGQDDPATYSPYWDAPTRRWPS